MIYRVKELWQRRSSIERVLGAQVDGVQAELLSGPGEIIWLAYITYKLERDRKTAEFGLNRPGDVKAEDRAEREKQFNDWADDASQEEVNVNVPPVPISSLNGLKLSTIDFVMLREIGLLNGS